MLSTAAQGSPRSFRKIMSVSFVLGLTALALVSRSDFNGARRLMLLRGEMTDVNAETLELIEDEAHELLDYEDTTRELYTSGSAYKNGGGYTVGNAYSGLSLKVRSALNAQQRRKKRARARKKPRITRKEKKIRQVQTNKVRHFKDLAIVLGRDPTEAELEHSEKVGYHEAIQEIRRKYVQAAKRRKMHHADLLAALDRDPTDAEVDSSLEIGHSKTMRAIHRRGGHLANDSHGEKRWRSAKYVNLRDELRQKRQAFRKMKRQQ